jgi:hypothetical protein
MLSAGFIASVTCSLVTNCLVILVSVFAVVTLRRLALVVSQRLTIISLMISSGCSIAAAILRKEMLVTLIASSSVLIMHGTCLFSLTLTLFPVTFASELSTP